MADLKPLLMHEKIALAVEIVGFFSPLGSHRKEGAEFAPVNNTLRPLSVTEFFTWHEKRNGNSLFPRYARVTELIAAIERANIIQSVGGGFGPQAHYLSMHSPTARQKKGILWLGKAIGLDVVSALLSSALVRLVGKTKDGDQRTGSGVVVGEKLVLTCAHNLLDMALAAEVYINEEACAVADSVVVSEQHDVGLILLRDSRQYPNDLALGDAKLLEQALIAGFPPVPQSVKPVLSFQTGEITGETQAYDGTPTLLVSAITRPGNSGGPVISPDGRILGIVTRSLERPREAADNMEPVFPFFTALPASTIVKLCAAHTPAFNLPWEDYS
jgi:hypothetical protein